MFVLWVDADAFLGYGTIWYDMAVGSSEIVCVVVGVRFLISVFLVCKIEDTGQWLFDALQVFICVVEKFEEFGGLGRGKTSQGDVVLVWVIFSRELSVVHFDLHVRCAESKSEDC